MATILCCATLFTQAQQSSGLGSLLGKLSGSTTTQTTDTTQSNQAGSQIGNILGTVLGNGSNTNATQEDATTPTTNGAGGVSSIIGGLLGGSSGSQSDNGSSSALGSALGSILNSVINANTELTVADLNGSWIYAAPACKFMSEDFLKSAGGDVVASQISSKIAPYYTKLGFTAERFSFTFDTAGVYTMHYGAIPLSGNVTKAEEKGYFKMEFLKLGTSALLTTPAYIDVAGNKMVILFEADKFIALFRQIVNKLGVTTLNSVFSLLDGYDGVLIGFEFNRKV